MKLKTRLFIALVTIGVLLTVMGLRDWICLSKPTKDITELWEYDYTNLKPGDHVCFDVTLVFDTIGSQIEQSKTYGVTTSERETNRYYLLPFCQDEDAEYIYPTPFLLVKIPSRFNSAFDTQISKFDTWWENDEDFSTAPTSTMHFEGKIVKLPKDLRNEIESVVYPGEDLEDYMLPLMFEPIMSPGAVKGMTIVGIICLLITGVIVFLMFKGKSSNQNGLYGMPNTQKAGFVPQSVNTAGTGAGFGGQQPQNGFGNTVDPYASPQPQNTQGNFGTAMGGQQPQNGQGSFGTAFGGQQPQNGQGSFGTAFGGQQPQNMQGSFGNVMGGQQPQNMQGSFGTAMGGQQPQNTAGSFGSPMGTPQSQGMALGGMAAATQAVQPLGPSQPLGSQPTGTVSSGSFPSAGMGSQAPTQEPASIFGNTPTQEPASIFGNTPTQEPESIFGNTPTQEPASIFGNTPTQEPTPTMGTAPTQEPESIFGNTPTQEPTPTMGTAPTQEPASNVENGSFKPVLNMFGEIDVEATEKAKIEFEAAEKAKKEEEARAELLKAMAYASSHPAVLPMGGGGTAVQQSSQAATLPLGVNPTEVSSGPSTNAAPAQEAETHQVTAPTQEPVSSPAPVSTSASPTQQNNNPLYANTPAQQPAPSPVGGGSAPTQQNNNPLYANTPAQQPAPSPIGGNSAPTEQNNNPLYGSAPAQQPANPSAENENAPLYADNTEMKKVFSGAFGNNNNS